MTVLFENNTLFGGWAGPAVRLSHTTRMQEVQLSGAFINVVVFEILVIFIHLLYFMSTFSSQLPVCRFPKLIFA
jgi:hypothetical protein